MKARPRRYPHPRPGRDPVPRLRVQRRNALRTWADTRVGTATAAEVLRVLAALPDSVDARVPRQEARTLAQAWGWATDLEALLGEARPARGE